MLFYYKAPAAQRNIPINQQQEASGLKILIFYSGRFFAVLNNSYKSAGTLVLLVLCRLQGIVEKQQEKSLYYIPADFSLCSTTRANQPAHQSCWYIRLFLSHNALDFNYFNSVVILIIKKHSFRIYVLKQHLFGCMLRLVRQPGVASLSFATPGYRSVALRAIANKSAQQSC